MNFLKYTKIIIIFVTIFFSLAVYSEASSMDPNLIINSTPRFPKANQTVFLNIESSSVDLDKSDIYWYKNGILKRKGLGEKTFSFETRGLGKTDKILVKVAGPSSRILKKEIVIRPADVDLIWESNSFTPPFYRGKALNSYQSDIKIVAIPNLISKNGIKISNKDLVYKWRKDWTVLGSKSGMGKNTLFLNGMRRFRDSVIVVNVESLDGSVSAQKTITIKSYKPQIVFYKKDSLLGILFNKALSGEFNLKEDEVAVVAAPLFFSKKDNLKYNWTMNGKKIDNNLNTIILRQDGDKKEGRSHLGLEVTNNKRIMQSMKEKINIVFGSESNNFFK